jgi:hypothetical protein
MKEYPDRINEIASDVVKDVDTEKYGIITIIMIIGITLTFIRILQECDKNKNLSEADKVDALQKRLKELSERRGWYTKLRIRKVLRQHLGKEVYKEYKDLISNNLLDIGKSLNKQDLQLLMEQLND